MDPKDSVHEPYVWKRHSFTGAKFPKRRIVRSFLMMVPWINLMVIGMLLWCVSRQTLVQPGRVAVLPKGPVDAEQCLVTLQITLSCIVVLPRI